MVAQNPLLTSPLAGAQQPFLAAHGREEIASSQFVPARPNPIVYPSTNVQRPRQHIFHSSKSLQLIQLPTASGRLKVIAAKGSMPIEHTCSHLLNCRVSEWHTQHWQVRKQYIKPRQCNKRKVSSLMSPDHINPQPRVRPLPPAKSIIACTSEGWRCGRKPPIPGQSMQHCWETVVTATAAAYSQIDMR